MRKIDIIKKIESCGDAIVTFRSYNSKKLKYLVVTRDFSTKYLIKKRTHETEGEHEIKVFSWDTDSYKFLKVNQIESVTPLSKVLNNHGYL